MISQVNDFLWRGPRPSPEDLFTLEKMGVKVLINLEWFEREETENPQDFGMEEINLPCSDITPPETWVLDKFIRIMQCQLKTYVHCKSGVDRTGLVIAGYRMRVDGWPYSIAKQEWINMGRHWWYWWWDRRLKEWEPVRPVK